MSALGARVAVVEAPLALYRRYRPETFSEVIGQDHVTVPLRNALSNNRVNHAYLFSGPRGCGKTTSARILARAINCEKGPIAEPCGVCKSCTDLARGGPGSIDVIEIDAASHGGVDDARDLRERAFFAPVESRYKIYIIDEAHMVTTQGFNALLKLVEEPPPHLKFIFATTEPDKVIGTIRSRTHHYPFRLVPPKALADYMATLCESEGVTIEPAALPLVVRAGAGSVRDSLSVLDQLMGGADAEGVTYRLAVQLLGFTPDSLLDACVDGFAAHDSKAVFETIEKVIETGQDPKRFAEDLLRRLRDLVILSAVPNAVASGLIEAAEDQGERLQTQAAGIGPAELTRAADIVAAGLLEMRGATAPRLQLELICAKVLLPGADDSTNGIQARLDRMERRLTITGGAPGTAPAAATANLGGAAGGVGPAGTAPGAGYPDQPAATQAGQSSGPVGQSAGPAGHSGVSAGQPGAPGGQSGVTAGLAGGQAASGRAAASGQAAAGGPVGQAGSSTAGDPSAAAGGSGQLGGQAGQAGQQQGRVAGGESAPAAAASQAGPALVDNTGSRSGAWGDEPTAGSAQGRSGAAAANVTPAAPAAAPAAASTSSNVSAQGAGPAVAGTSSGSVGLVDVRRLWPQILEAVKAKRRFAWIMLSQNAQVIAIDEQTLTLGLVNAGARESFARSGSDEILRQAMIDTLGLNRRVEAVVDPSSDPTATTPAAPPASAPPSSSWDAPASSPPGNAPGGYPSAGGPADTAPGGSAQAGGHAAGGVGGGTSAGGAAGGASAGGSAAGSSAVGGLGASAGGAAGGGGAYGGDAGASAGSGSNAPTDGHAGPGMGNASGAPNGAGVANAPGTSGSGANTGGANPGGANTGGANAGGANAGGANAGGANAGDANAGGPNGPGAGGAGAGNGGAGAGQGSASAAGTANASVGGGPDGGAVATAVRVPENAAGQLGAAGSPAVVVRDAGNEQAGLQADQQADGPPAPAANPAPVTEDRRTQAASKRRAAEAAVAAEQSRRAAQVQVEEAPLTPEEEAEAIGDDDIVLEEDSRSHTDLLAETLGAQIISEEPN
ncbi:DNA polymerase III subunit gamma and tau [Kribbella sp. CA-294648]|uniref:DNA polymerase III subunit gamma and tau n=1 Tax=Kribbella sp. CA-294648 TaxID=3239948 RepID=UPI003D8FA57E